MSVQGSQGNERTRSRSLVVIAVCSVGILVILLFAFGPLAFKNVSDGIHEAQARPTEEKRAKARETMARLMNQLDLYRLDTGSYPTLDQGLEALITQPNNVRDWKGPYAQEAEVMDPWEHPYAYYIDDSTLPVKGPPLITCFGADGAQEGTGDSQDFSSEDIQR